MNGLVLWGGIVAAVALAALTNSVSTAWAKAESQWSAHLLCLCVLSPAVFVTFGLVTKRLGMSVAAGVIDSSLTLLSIVIGLLWFHEWATLSRTQCIGILLSSVGVILMVAGRR